MAPRSARPEAVADVTNWLLWETAVNHTKTGFLFQVVLLQPITFGEKGEWEG
jgi:hypothetical protein